MDTNEAIAAVKDKVTGAPARWTTRIGIAFGMFGCALAALILAVIFHKEISELYFTLSPGGEGIIVVDSPEVYTRERLINDRLEEHIWLMDQLRLATNTKRIFEGYVQRSRTASVGTNAASPAPAPEVKNVGSQDGNAQDLAAEYFDPQADLRIAFDDEFRLRSAVRDQIRQRILENQLDDRHDLYGNSLYVLKFDSTIVPAPHSRQRAYIKVSIDTPPMYDAARARNAGTAGKSSASAEALTYFQGGQERLNDWTELFERWQLDLATRLDESAATESEGFLLGHWKSADYDELRSYMLSRMLILGVATQDIVQRWSQPAETRAAIQSLIDSNPDVPVSFSELVAEFFGARSMRLVLGIQVGPHSHDNVQIRWTKDTLLYRVDPLAQYVDINMRRPSHLGDAPDFAVEPRWDRILVTDGKCKQAPKPEQASEQLRVTMFNRWKETEQNLFAETPPQYRLTPELYAAIKKNETGAILLSPSYSKTVGLTNCSKIELIALPSGLFNFIEKIARADLYSYAVLPRESVRATVTEILDRLAVSNVGSSAGGLSASAALDEVQQGARLSATVTSFSSTGRYGNEPEDKPEFGWIVNPSASLFSDEGPEPIAESMMAIVSVPAWWEQLQLTLETGWIENDVAWQHDTAKATPPSNDPNPAATDAAAQDANANHQTINVVLPNSYEGIDAFLMQVKRRKPVIVEADFEQSELTACAPASLLIRGSRLWRNSVVTLGAQEADSIRVMPNMDGILASFKQVAVPDHLDNDHGSVKLRVWTSEGVAELRQEITILLPTTIAGNERALKRCPSSGDKTLGLSAKAN